MTIQFNPQDLRVLEARERLAKELEESKAICSNPSSIAQATLANTALIERRSSAIDRERVNLNQVKATPSDARVNRLFNAHANR